MLHMLFSCVSAKSMLQSELTSDKNPMGVVARISVIGVVQLELGELPLL